MVVLGSQKSEEGCFFVSYVESTWTRTVSPVLYIQGPCSSFVFPFKKERIFLVYVGTRHTCTSDDTEKRYDKNCILIFSRRKIK